MGKYATNVDQFKQPPRERFLVCFGSQFPSASPSFAFCCFSRESGSLEVESLGGVFLVSPSLSSSFELSCFSREFGSPAVGGFSLSHPITILRITYFVLLCF
jgi:hypothetical protein